MSGQDIVVWLLSLALAAIVCTALRNVWLRLRMARRIGAFARLQNQGMSAEEARSQSDRMYPPTAADRAYEAAQRRKQLAKSS